MPSTRPCASFEPISPEFNVKQLVETTPNFEWVVRIHCDMIDHQGIEQFEKLVLIHVILGGKPLVIEGYDTRLDRWTFAVQWLRDNTGTKVENPRDLTKKTNVPMTFAHYLNHMALLTNQWTSTNYKDPQRQRIYLKDIDCPQLWHDKLQTILPPFTCYLNGTTGDINGLGATDEPDPSGTGYRKGKGIAKAGDLMSCLPKEMRAENMMCYIGHEGTYTPAHREMCASLGQNIMVEASTGHAEDGKPTKPGSSIWFMTENKEREVVAEYWLSRLGHDIEVENHFAQINAWKNAPFKTWVIEQKPGDLILIPPLAPHQVWNRGTRTMKVAWNRTTVETLEMAMNEALPKARMVCRDEQYKNKAIIYFALQQYSRLLKLAEKHRSGRHGKSKEKSDTKVRQLEKDFRRLHGLFTTTLVAESFLQAKQEKCEMVPYEGFITCSYCRCNIFNRFLTCTSCVIKGGDQEDTYDICLECYSMGRSCACISKLKWAEQFSWIDLIQKHEAWRHQILAYEGKITEKSPMSLKVELQRLGSKRTLAQICQLELQRRPFRDIKKPPPQPEAAERYEEVEVDEHGNTKKKKKVKRSDKFLREHTRCHVDGHYEPKWKQAECSNCGKSYCFGVLFRAYDQMPQDILADPDWTCPSCQGICGCRRCKIQPGYTPYTPSGTRLGHDTKAVADARSVESLVDFSFSNIGWIQKAGDDNENTRRLHRRRMEADAALAENTQLGEGYVDDDAANRDVEDGILRLAQQEGIPVDPALAAMNPPNTPGSADDEDMSDENPEGRHESSFGKAIMAPQYVIPDGGVLRTEDHAYDYTEAITYDYPDPNMVVAPVPVPDEDVNNSGYGPAEPGDDHIEMVQRKRKRKLDESEKAFVFNRSLNPPKKQASAKKQQRSLIVKLPIAKDKLIEINRMAIMTQRALNGVEPAPAAVGSDLQALNASYPNTEGQPVAKKARTEEVVVDRDTEYAPSRRRDRRKPGPNGELPTRTDEVTRRRTRTQAVTYEEDSDEEEFNDMIQPRKEVSSKLATMENAIDVDDISEFASVNGQDSTDGAARDAEGIAADTDADQDDVDSTPEPGMRPISGLRPATSSLLNVVRTADSPSTSVSRKASSPPPSRPSSAVAPRSSAITAPQPSATSSAPRSTVTTSTRPSQSSANARLLAEAAANRKAKMALEDEFSDEFSDEWSDREQQPVASPEKNKQPAQPPSTDEMDVDSPPPSITKPTQPAPAASPPIQKTIETVSASNSVDRFVPKANGNTIAPPKPLPSSSSAVKLTAADWSDSDSDDDVAYASKVVPKPAPVAPPGFSGSGWASVNGTPTSTTGAGRGRGRGGGVVVKRGRGRPPLHR